MSASETIRIPARFNGPPDSANGGYTCGLVARAMSLRCAEVTLRRPPPLETDLAIERLDRGVAVRDGDDLVAEGKAAQLDLELAAPVDPERAAAAAREGRERWAADHPFPGCAVCGPARRPGEGLRLSPGPLGAEGAFACDWTPDGSLAGAGGVVCEEYVWAALDCPTCAPVTDFGERAPLVLARLAASLDAPVRAGEPHAIVAWPLGRSGRRRTAAAALFDSGGRALAHSRALWIELRETS